jgi:hypothetical protein
MPDTFPLPWCAALLIGDITDVNDMPVALNSCSLAGYRDSCPSRTIALDALRSEARRSNAGELDLPPGLGPVSRLIQPATALSTGYGR